MAHRLGEDTPLGPPDESGGGRACEVSPDESGLIVSAESTGFPAVLAHWLCALPILLMVAWLCIRQIDLYPPSVDEFYSLLNVGFATESAYSPGQVLESLQTNSANHGPLYFILLNMWGRLAGEDIALARVLIIFCGLLSLAVVFRLARYTIAPLAGLMALVIAASSTFFNFYITYARMYTLLALLAGITMWLYLRLVQGRARGTRADYLALAAATYALANTHVFSAVFFLALGAYHLLHVRKDRRWLHVSLAVGAGLLLFAPWLTVLLGAGMERSFFYLGDYRPALLDNLVAWLAVTFNGSWLLLLMAVAGWLLCWRARLPALRSISLIGLYFVLALGLVAELTGILAPNKMRYALAGWIPIALCLAAAQYGLMQWRSWLGLLSLLWLVAGISFQQNTDWDSYFSGRELSFAEPPWQVLSRWAQAEDKQPTIYWYGSDAGHLNWNNFWQYPQSDYYFSDHGIELETFVQPDRFERHARHLALSEAWHWLVLDESQVDATAAAQLDDLMTALNYRACESSPFGLSGRLVKYSWVALACQDLPATVHDNALVDYEFYGAALSQDATQLLVVDRWLARDTALPAQTNLSLQLLDAEWQRLASLDLPLATRPGLRQSALDIRGVAAGDYRLMAAIYDSQTMLRSEWQAADESTAMRQLASIIIPEK